MPVTVESSTPRRLALVDLKPRGPVHPSPLDWRDQFIYLLMPDRFSDGREDQRPLFDRASLAQFKSSDKRLWMTSGKGFQGGTLKGIESKLDYLRRLGVTTLLIGPVWRQRPDLETYHGYGVQHFLDVDPRFGTRQDLRHLIDAAHERGMYVLLDIVLRHTGNNWFYDVDGNPREMVDYRFEPSYPFHSWRSGTGKSIRTIESLDDGIWPEEFQDPDWYLRAGRITRWDPDPWEHLLHQDNEFRRGDFCELKALNLKRQDVLEAVIRTYQYWIALSDCDGFRVDTVKHCSRGVCRDFCAAIREYGQAIGKDNFFLLGEVTGGSEMARAFLDIRGCDIDAILDIGEPTKRLAGMVKGFTAPGAFFDQFGELDVLGHRRKTGLYHVSILDDHDMVARRKHRFTANNDIPHVYEQVAHAAGVQLTTLGIPCIYYGTEQAFDGTEDRHDYCFEPKLSFEDRYVRESMFGSGFGPFETTGCHFFDPDHPTYLRTSAIAQLRNQQSPIGRALRRGRQYLRETSFLRRPFRIHGHGEITAWSRILHDQEVVVVLNTHGTAARGAEIVVEASLHSAGSAMTFLYKSDWSDTEFRDPPRDQTVRVKHGSSGATIRIDLHPAGMVILA